MESRIQILKDFNIDFQKLKQNCEFFLEQNPFHPRRRQICLTHRKDSIDPYYEGTGSLYNYEEARFVYDEKDFCIFHQDWRSSYLHEVYLQMKQLLPYQVGRVRLMLLNPATCLSIHKDSGFRLHIPIETNPNSFFIFPDQVPVHLSADGSVYLVNTTHFHTAINGDRHKPRVHLVASLV